MASNPDALIELGVDIPTSKANIQAAIEEIRKGLKPLEVGLNIDEASRNRIANEIKNIRGDAEKNKVQMNIDASAIQQQASAIQNTMRQSGQASAQGFVDSFLNKIRTTPGIKTQEMIDESGIKSSEKTIDELRNKLMALSEVQKVSFNTNFDAQGNQLKSFTANVTLATGETEKLSYALNENENAFRLLDNISGSTAGVEKMTSAYNKFTAQLSEFKKVNGQMSGINDQVNNVSAMIEGLKTGSTTIEQVQTAFTNLKVSANEIKGAVSGLGTSFDPLKNAVNNMRTMPDTIANLSTQFSQLKTQPAELGEKISQLSAKFAELRQIESSEGVGMNWANKYHELDLAVKEVTSSMGVLKKEEAAMNAIDLSTINTKIIKLADNIDILGSKWNSFGMESSSLKIVKKELSEITALQTKMNQETDNKKKIALYQELDQKVRQCKNDYEAMASSMRVANNEMAAQDKQAVLLSRIEAYIRNNTRAAREYGDAMDQIRAKVAAGGSTAEMQKLGLEWRKLTTNIRAAGKEGQSFSDKFAQNLKELTRFLSVTTVVMSGIRTIRQMATVVQEVDDAMVSFRKVTDLTAQEEAAFFEKATQSAKQLGTTISDTIEQTANWVKLGFTTDQAEELAKISTIYKQVGEIADNDTAVGDLVTAMKAFNIEADDSITIVDSLNKLGNEFSTDAASLGEGLTKSASALNLAGNDINSSLAMLTGMTEITQNASESGNALKILSMRLRGMKGDLEALGEESEGLESISKIQTHILNLTKGQVNIFKDNGDFKSTYEIIKDISEVWDHISQTDQADLLETIAGKQRGNSVAALIQAFQSGQVEKALNASIDSSGSAIKEFTDEADSITFKINQFKDTFQELSTNTLKSDFMKSLVDVGTGLLGLVDKFGLLNTAIASFTLVYSLKTGNSIFAPLISGAKTLFSSVGELKTGFSGLFQVFKTSGFKGVQSAIDNLITNDDVVKIKKYNKALETMSPSAAFASSGMDKASGAAQDLVAANNGAAVSQEQLKSAMLTTGAAAKVASVGLGLLKAAAGMVAMMALAKGVSFVTEKINEMQHAQERAIETGSKATTEYNADTDGLDEKIEKYKELNEKIQNTTLTEEERTTIKTELLSLQEEINSLCGQEADNVDLVNGKYDEQLEKLQNISAEKAKNYLQDNRDAYDQAKKYMEDKDDYVLGSQQDYMSHGFNPELSDIISNLGFEKMTINNGSTENVVAFKISIDKENAYNKLTELYDEVEAYYKNHQDDELVDRLLNSISKYKSELTSDEEFSNAKNIIDTYTKVLIQSDGKLKQLYNDSADAVARFNKANTEGDVTGAIQAQSDIDALKQKIQETAGLTSEQKYVFDSVFDKMSADADSVSSQSEKIKELMTANGKSGSDVDTYLKGKTGEEIAIAYKIISVSDTPGMTFEQLDEKIKSYKGNEDKKVEVEAEISSDSVTALSTFKDQIATVKEALSGIENLTAEQEVDLMAKFPEADWQSYLTGVKDLKTVLNEFLQDEMNELLKDCPQLQNVMDRLFNDAFGNATDKVEDLTDALYGLKDGFGVLQSVYDNLNDKDFKFIDPEDIAKLKEQFGEMDGWDAFYNMATSGNASASQLKQGLSNLSDEALNNSSVMQNLTEDNKNYAKQVLESYGITNAEALIQEQLKQANDGVAQAYKDLQAAKIDSVKSSSDLANMTGTELGALLEELHAAGLTSQALYNLAVQKGYVSGITIDESANVKNQADLTHAADVTSAALGVQVGAKLATNKTSIMVNGDVQNEGDLTRAADTASNAVANTANAKIASNNASINTSGDIQNLADLVYAAQKAQEAVNRIKNTIVQQTVDTSAINNANSIIDQYTHSSSKAIYDAAKSSGYISPNYEAVSAQYDKIVSNFRSSLGGGNHKNGSGGSRVSANYKSPTVTGGNNKNGSSGGSSGKSGKSGIGKNNGSNNKYSQAKEEFEKVYDNIQELYTVIQDKIDAKLAKITDYSSMKSKENVYKAVGNYYEQQKANYSWGIDYYKGQMKGSGTVENNL